MTGKRNGYLVSKALRTFMWASILAALAQQLTTTTDAIVVSHLIGPDAISAVNVVMPLMTLFSCIGILFGMGGSVLAAKAIGRRDMEETNHVFTTVTIIMFAFGLTLSVVGSWLTPDITKLVCPVSSRIYSLAVSYLQPMMVGAVFSLINFTLQTFVKTDGAPRLVMRAVMLSTVLNLILDILFIKVFGMGIDGSAWASVLCYVASVFVCLLHFRNPTCSFRWKMQIRGIGKIALRSAAEGFPMSINTLLLGVCIYGFNSIVLHYLGADGMYVWSVCLQLFIIQQMVMGGIGSSVYSIGGLLVGEQDMLGLTILIRRVTTYICGIMLVVTLFVILLPNAFGIVFGSSGIDVGDLLRQALRIFSLMLIPYAIVAILRSLYQMIGYRGMSVVLSVAQLVVMVFFVWAFALFKSEMLWWGFPVSAIILLLFVFLMTLQKHRRQPQIALMTLIPQTTEGEALNFSIRLTNNDVNLSLKDIIAFLKECRVDDTTAYNVRLCCDELLSNILNYAVKKHPEKHFVDIHIRNSKSQVSVLLKDDGSPFNPILKKTPAGFEHIGLRLVNGSNSTMNYKYMYDQNMVFMTFKRK